MNVGISVDIDIIAEGLYKRFEGKAIRTRYACSAFSQWGVAYQNQLCEIFNYSSFASEFTGERC